MKRKLLEKEFTLCPIARRCAAQFLQSDYYLHRQAGL
jgi:hypothetical protein